MFIFRMEDKNGLGPWIGKHVFQIPGLPKYDNLDDYPGLWPDFQHATKKKYDYYPSEFNKNKWVDFRKYVCGTRSLEEFLHWFPIESLEQFFSRENFICVYRINKNCVKFGKKQIMFRPEHAKLIIKIIPTEYELISSYEAKNVYF